MDIAFRTPLIDLFARGEVPAEARLMAARGALAPRAHEQLVLLALLSEDPDEQVRAQARATLDRVPQDVLARFLARHDVGDDLRAFFADRGVQPAGESAEAADDPLVTDPDADASTPNEEAAAGPPGGEPDEAQRTAAAQRLSKLTVAERMKRAMLGTREERFLLIRDTNRLIATCVLSSPKLTPVDVEAFAKMQNVAEDVLRIIGNSRHWVKRYPVAAALALNPKTPVAVSLTLVPRLVEREIKAIVRDRNMPEPVRAAARRVMATTQSRRG
jgi:hypothetical protein